jgi:hypothetical protein
LSNLSEHRNLYAERADKARELKELLEKYKREGRSTPGAPQQNDVARETSEDFVKSHLQMLPHDQNAVYDLR